MKRVLLILLLFSILAFSCSKEDQKKGQSEEVSKADSIEAPAVEDFSFESFLDSTSDTALKTAAVYLQAIFLEGDYKKAAGYLCRNNQQIIEEDSVMQFVFFGQDNPEWDDLKRFRFEITRKYIPIVAGFNEITAMELAGRDSVCRVKYEITGPYVIKNIFDAALGEGGKPKFDKFVDSNVSLQEKREYYDYAFARLTKMADSLDFSKRKVSDTITLIWEDNLWKICHDAQRSWDIFRPM